ncbi:MFS transporter [Nocardioides sp. CER19]|uniref:MFS transporter n=1 Tax=Nocardioides sp. CER19 TaxID=3038538 RepID=UPI00244B44AD|nr:MFS transporter [Nocardioides sp. CER19]MDH2415249.1 MFS transporter [Nocardioides sp. CER19]
MSQSTTRLTPAARRHHARGFWLVALLFAATLAFATVPAPRYGLYAAEDGFGSFTVTVIFAVYAVGVALSLYLTGHLSDRYGRRRLVIPAVMFNIMSGLVFVTSHELGWLLLARFLCGVGVGMLTATATAHLIELHRHARPNAAPTLAGVVATAANLGGLALGPLVAGFLAQYVGRPLFTPFVVFLFILSTGVLLVATVPETVELPADEWRYRPQRISIPEVSRAGFWAASIASFVAFASFGFFSSLAPSFVAGTLHHTSHALAGFVAFSAFGAAAMAQIIAATWRIDELYVIGLIGLAAGLVLTVVAILSATLATFIAGGLIVGIGAGLAFKGGVSAVIQIAPPAVRGETLATLFLVAYVGMGLPVVLLGIALQLVTVHAAVLAFGALMLILIAASALLITTGRRPRPVSA